MLDILRSIVTEVNAARSLDQALVLIVERMKTALMVDVCSIYLVDHDSGELVLMASDGLLPESVGYVRLGFDEGLVGLVAQRAEPLNLDNAPDHPRYRYFSETGEEWYHAFLGVPIIHHRKVLGVLVLQQHAEHRYDEDIVTLLVTIAAQLAGAIAHAEASGGIDGLQTQRNLDGYPLRGLPGAPGVAIGRAVAVSAHADVENIPDRPVDDVVAEQDRFLEAVRQVKQDVRAMVDNISDALPAADSALFDAYLLMLDSDTLIGDVTERIRAGNWAPGALRETILEHIRAFNEMDDPYLRERAEDVRDLGRRILLQLQQKNAKGMDYPKNTILVGEEITASMLAEVPAARLVGVVSVRGSRTSHTAILARALGIPAVLGVDDMPVGRINDREIIADGYSGRVYVNAPKEIKKEYRRLQQEERELTADLQGLRDEESVTTDGVHIPLYANTGLLSDIGPSIQSGAEGVGLYRTEFPFMVRDRFPGEEEQRQVYRQVLEAFAPRPVTMRTLDVGGDKALPYFPIDEDNPFLGWRGIRITLDHPEIFLVQIRAMLKAAVGLGNLQLLLPMISTLSEVDEAIHLIRRAHHELLEEGEAVAMPKIGAMVEVPSLLYQIEPLARRVDFLSVGSNDLTQYLLAVDRNNARVAELYDSLHPAVIQALKQVVEGAKKHRVPVSVCGEMAGDPAAALLLLGLGINSLSMSASSLLRIKWVVRSFSRRHAKSLLGKVMAMEDAKEIRAYLTRALEKKGLGGLIRAGR
ncbi:MAG: phosphoenolpyruvate--protein phosphotransferase [Gammaproteobacteria bacterium]|nr:phosphoenolpyruvate--protein phosphotransferase [Gammaproteobacteria bacterium]MCW8958844.1 phosphoenolpyruvate--protein phosphotransferase [Gammaproteobacteria bacterium]MCW8971673.1 phosphoenolpyruvate--protein phosphotransferase [Gammaproteobacteria bacterium]MCW8993422.1 phosphoenolpyruvate--protein phosphotransferase [Gammaproteobacteria bacterium]